MTTDPIVSEVRHAREVLSAKFNHDVAAIVHDAQKRQKQSKLKVVSFKPRKVTRAGYALQGVGVALKPAAATADLPVSRGARSNRVAR